MIGQVLCMVQSAIGKEPLCERGLPDGIAIHKLLDVIVIIKIDGLLVFEMNRQTINGRLLFMHVEFHDVPDGLYRTDVTTAYVI